MIGDICVDQVSKSRFFAWTVQVYFAFCSRNSLDSVFQSPAAENLDVVGPNLVLTNGRSNKVESLRDWQWLYDHFTK